MISPGSSDPAAILPFGQS